LLIQNIIIKWNKFPSLIHFNLTRPVHQFFHTSSHIHIAPKYLCIKVLYCSNFISFLYIVYISCPNKRMKNGSIPTVGTSKFLQIYQQWRPFQTRTARPWLYSLLGEGLECYFVYKNHSNEGILQWLPENNINLSLYCFMKHTFWGVLSRDLYTHIVTREEQSGRAPRGYAHLNGYHHHKYHKWNRIL